MTDAAADAWIATMSTVLALPLADADVTEIRANLIVAHRMSGMIGDAATGDHVEPLPVYRA